MVLNSFLMILSGLLRGLGDFLTVFGNFWLFGIRLVLIRIVGQAPKNRRMLGIIKKIVKFSVK